MNRHTARWLLAPLRQIRACRLMAQHGPALPYDTAWALTTLHTAPEEIHLVRAWAGKRSDGPPGIHYDQWHKLSKKEQHRRQNWLRRHGRSPVQLLHVDGDIIRDAGIHVVDWGPDQP